MRPILVIKLSLLPLTPFDPQPPGAHFEGRNFYFSTSGCTSAASPHHRTLLIHARDDVSDIVPRETWLSQHSRGLAHELEK